jgi:hypothetical protein
MSDLEARAHELDLREAAVRRRTYMNCALLVMAVAFYVAAYLKAESCKAHPRLSSGFGEVRMYEALLDKYQLK